jgi:ADP-ribosylglycohydrolase
MKKHRFRLYGAILGDLCGQPHEFPSNEGFGGPIIIHNPLSKITDDTIMTIATAYALLGLDSFEKAYKEFGLKYDGDHYGKNFKEWIRSPMGTVGNSWGNGCVMRISPLFYLSEGRFRTRWINESVACSHDTEESYEAVRLLEEMYTNEPTNEIVELKKFDKFVVRALPTVKFVNDVFVSSKSTHDAILKAVSCGGDTDTNASIVGELSNFWREDITDDDVEYVNSKLDPHLLKVLRRFNDECDAISKY